MFVETEHVGVARGGGQGADGDGVGVGTVEYDRGTVVRVGFLPGGA
ncbi:hypothetical protein [Saccharopolyspora spinosa]|nr:hypothetical protein [Saccharopolyspora spinosa]